MKEHLASSTPEGGQPGPGMLRVCHIAYTFYEEDNRVTRYAEALCGDGHHVDVIALRRPGQAPSGERSGVRVHRIQQRSVTERSAWCYLLKILLFLGKAAMVVSARHLRRRYDIIHVHNIPDFLVFAALVPRLTGTPVILDIHDILPELYARKFAIGAGSRVLSWLLFVERLSCRFASHVIVANDIWRAKLVRRSVAPGDCTTVLNYPDLRVFAPLPPGRPADGGKFVMLYPGSLNHHQGLHVAIRAFARACNRMPGSEFHIYGEGPARDYLRELAKGLSVHDRVRFQDPVPLEAIARIMAGADLGVEPKLGDSFAGDAVSTKILEFMASGVPVIVSRTAAHQRYFDETVARFFPAGDEIALSEAMLECYQHRSNQAEMIQRARKWAVNYSWQQHADDYRDLVTRLLAGRCRGAFAGSRPA
ncbi:MAG: glycosyltransferase family 4 protein [Bryobacterales bacterium]|nr:glycosyltransferase family 4 protein [Bryobacterales bacterium]